MSLPYAFIDSTSPVPLPPFRANGGLYTGEEARGDWGSFPSAPESHIQTTKNLLSANPPPGAVQQSVSLLRPGNNYVEHPFHVNVPGYNGMYIGK